MSAEDPTPHLDRFTTYEQACREFHSSVPERFNIAESVLRRHRDAVTRVGLIEVRPAANNTYTIGALDYFSDKLATVLSTTGIVRGDAVAVMLPPSGALVVSHLAVLKLGAKVVSMAPNMSPSNSELILNHTAARALIIDQSNRGDVAFEVGDRASIRAIFVVADAIHGQVVGRGDRSFWREVYAASAKFEIADTPASAPAFVFCSADRNGLLRTVIHSNASLVGGLAMFEMVNDFDLGDDAVFWTSLDWASTEALFGLVLPALYYGVPLVAAAPMDAGGDDPFEIMQLCQVTGAFIREDRLRMWMREYSKPVERYGTKLRRVIVSNSALSQEMINWARGNLKVPLHSAFIDVEAGPVAATCERWFETKAGTVGRPVPGRAVGLLDDEGGLAPRGSSGRIAVRVTGDSVLADRVGGERQGRSALEGDWYVTGQVGIKDEDGNLFVRF